MIHCPYCPRRHSGRPCIRHYTGARRVCDLLDPAHPDHIEGWDVEAMTRAFERAGKGDPAVIDDGRHIPLPGRPGWRIPIRCHASESTGYGQHARDLGQAAERLGIPVAYIPISADEAHRPLSPWMRSRIVPDHRDRWEILLAGPPDRHRPGRRTVHFSMWESTVLPEGFREGLAKAALVLVPSRWMKRIFEENGIVAPVEVVPHGVDLNVFHPAPEFTPSRQFLLVARTSHGGDRKGVEQAIGAFLTAFPRGEDYTLRVKLWPDDPLAWTGDDPRVIVDRRCLSDGELADLMRNSLALVSASRGEGFGLPGAQALACGTPVIATGATGDSEYLDADVGYPVRYRWEPAGGYYSGSGLWAVPDTSSLVESLRRAARRPDEARAKGMVGAGRMESMTWDHSARKLIAALRKHGYLERPGRAEKGFAPGGT